MNHGEINKSLGLNNELTKRVDFFLKQIGVKFQATCLLKYSRKDW